MKRRQIAYVAQGFSLVLALGVGILIGARSCSKIEIQEIEKEKNCPTLRIEEKIVYQCPPENIELPTKKTNKKINSALVKKVKKAKKNLPKEKEIDQNKRRRLLAFVRSKSKSTLGGCRGARKEVYRLSVKITPKKDGTVRYIKLSAPPGEVPGSVLSCLRGRMKNWKLPVEDIVENQPIIWGLNL